MRLAGRPRIDKLEEKEQGVGLEKASFIHHGHAHIVSGSPRAPLTVPVPEAFLSRKAIPFWIGPPLCFHTCLQKQLLRQIQGTEGQMDGQLEEVALQTYREIGNKEAVRQMDRPIINQTEPSRVVLTGSEPVYRNSYPLL